MGRGIAVERGWGGSGPGAGDDPRHQRMQRGHVLGSSEGAVSWLIHIDLVKKSLIAGRTDRTRVRGLVLRGHQSVGDGMHGKHGYPYVAVVAEVLLQIVQGAYVCRDLGLGLQFGKVGGKTDPRCLVKSLHLGVILRAGKDVGVVDAVGPGGVAAGNHLQVGATGAEGVGETDQRQPVDLTKQRTLQTRSCRYIRAHSRGLHWEPILGQVGIGLLGEPRGNVAKRSHQCKAGRRGRIGGGLLERSTKKRVGLGEVGRRVRERDARRRQRVGGIEKGLEGEFGVERLVPARHPSSDHTASRECRGEGRWILLDQSRGDHATKRYSGRIDGGNGVDGEGLPQHRRVIGGEEGLGTGQGVHLICERRLDLTPSVHGVA